jgi:hypothetical protein
MKYYVVLRMITKDGVFSYVSSPFDIEGEADVFADETRELVAGVDFDTHNYEFDSTIIPLSKAYGIGVFVINSDKIAEVIECQ